MDLALSSDQIAILDAIDSLARPYASPPIHDTGFALVSEALNRELAEGGFLDVGFEPELGAVTAALIVERLARLPYAVEAASSALVRPLLGQGVSGPVCLVEAKQGRRPVRFLASGATVVVVEQGRVASFAASAEQARPVDTLFGYPMGVLAVDAGAAAKTTHDVSPDAVKTRWRIGLAAEAAGLLAAALESAVTYVTDRQQFGRPIAAFQAVRHRLAEAQVRASGVYWLALKAAGTLDAGDAALAAFHAQESARSVAYDLHQFLGAMGMTLEHPLHLWTYRLKALIGELGGRGVQGVDASDAIWG